MRKISLYIFTFCLILCAFAANGQNLTDMRLNEIVVKNTNGYLDDYGNRSAWVELFNTSYGTVDVAGCFLTDDPNNLKKYKIPKGDVLTKIKPRQHLLFFADNEPDKGTFHLNFTIDSTTTYLALVNADGRQILDELTFEAYKVPENLSYGRKVDGIGFTKPAGFFSRSWLISKYEKEANGDPGWTVLSKVTPQSANVIDNKESKLIRLKERDPHGGIMAVTAMSVVFSALIILYFLFRLVAARNIKMEEAKKQASAAAAAPVEAKQNVNVTVNADPQEYTDEEIAAAIVMAIHLESENEQVHDVESNILTFKQIYSPWGNKALIMKQTPSINR